MLVHEEVSERCHTQHIQFLEAILDSMLAHALLLWRQVNGIIFVENVLSTHVQTIDQIKCLLDCMVAVMFLSFSMRDHKFYCSKKCVF